MPAKKKKALPKKKTISKTKGAEVTRAAKAVVGAATAAAGTLGKFVASAFSIPQIGPKKAISTKKTGAKRKPVKRGSIATSD